MVHAHTHTRTHACMRAAACATGPTADGASRLCSTALAAPLPTHHDPEGVALAWHELLQLEGCLCSAEHLHEALRQQQAGMLIGTAMLSASMSWTRG